MKQLRLSRNSATFFHCTRVLPCLILFGMVLVTGCTLIDGTLPRPFRISEDPEGRLRILSFDDLQGFGAKIIQITEP